MATKKYIKLTFDGTEGYFLCETQGQVDDEIARIWDTMRDQIPPSRTINAEWVELDEAEYNALPATNRWWGQA